MSDGVKQKLDISKLKKLGWTQKISLENGIRTVVKEMSKII